MKFFLFQIALLLINYTNSFIYIIRFKDIQGLIYDTELNLLKIIGHGTSTNQNVIDSLYLSSISFSIYGYLKFAFFDKDMVSDEYANYITPEGFNQLQKIFNPSSTPDDDSATIHGFGNPANKVYIDQTAALKQPLDQTQVKEVHIETLPRHEFLAKTQTTLTLAQNNAQTEEKQQTQDTAKKTHHQKRRRSLMRRN
jgi:hypothetical protein